MTPTKVTELRQPTGVDKRTDPHCAQAAQAVYDLSHWDHGYSHVPARTLADAAVDAYLSALVGDSGLPASVHDRPDGVLHAMDSTEPLMGSPLTRAEAVENLANGPDVAVTPKGRCTRCNELGLRSRVDYVNQDSTALGGQEYYFWDEDGGRGWRSERGMRAHYRCSQGHHWTEQTRPDCGVPGCGWGSGPPVIAYTDDGPQTGIPDS